MLGLKICQGEPVELWNGVASDERSGQPNGMPVLQCEIGHALQLRGNLVKDGTWNLFDAGFLEINCPTVYPTISPYFTLR
jgi:hypothetical protein